MARYGKKQYQKGDLDPIFLKKDARQEMGDTVREKGLLWTERDGQIFYGVCLECKPYVKKLILVLPEKEFIDQAEEQWYYHDGLEHVYDKHHGTWLKLLVKWKTDKVQQTTTLERLLQAKL